MPLIKLQTTISADQQIVFDLARSIDLHTKSTAKTNEKAIAGTTSGLINLNETVTWRARHFGLYQTLTSKITQLDAPHLFVDEMVEGPFKRIHHLHTFSQINGLTLMEDEFFYESPLGILGRIADKLFLEKYLTNFLIIRNKMIKDYAETGKWKSLLPN